jgi:hypothetical protein
MVLIPLDVKKNGIKNDVRNDAQEQAGYQADYLARAGNLSFRLKTYASGMPSAVFIGGARDKHYIAVFSRPINAEDFVKLWSASSR